MLQQIEIPGEKHVLGKDLGIYLLNFSGIFVSKNQTKNTFSKHFCSRLLHQQPDRSSQFHFHVVQYRDEVPTAFFMI